MLYVAAGATMIAHGSKDSVRGTGAGVLAQVGFRFVFDAAGALVIAP